MKHEMLYRFLSLMLAGLLCLTGVCGVPVKAARASELEDAYSDLIGSTLECIGLLWEVSVENKQFDFKDFDTFTTQIDNLFKTAYYAGKEISGACADRVEAAWGKYLAVKKGHSTEVKMVYQWVLEDINLYGDADLTASRIEKLTSLTGPTSTSVTLGWNSVNDMLDDAVFCLFTPSDQLDLIKAIQADYEYMRNNATYNYQHVYRMIKREILANPPKPTFLSCSLTMPTTRTGFAATVSTLTEGVSGMKYVYKWYKDGALVTTQNSTSGKASYTINSAGVWHAVVSIQDSLGQTASMQTNKITVSQTPIKPTALTMNTTGYTLAPGQTVSLSVSYTPSNTTERGVTWSSSNTSVATVSSSGVVTAKAAGTAVITAKSSANSSVKTTCNITVSSHFKDLHVSNITTTDAQINVSLVKTYYLKECGFFFGLTPGSMHKVTEDLGGGTNVVSIWYPLNKWGQILSPGVTYYYQFYINHYDSIYYSAVQSFRTADVAVTGIALNSSALSLEKGASSALKVTYTPSNSTVGKELIWTSSNPEVATVANGTVTAVDGGEAVITAYTVGNEAIAASCTVKVHDPDDDVKLTGLTVSKNKLYAGEELSVTVSHSGVLGTNQFALALYKDGEVYSDFAAIDGVQKSWLLQEPGEYTVKAKITDAYLGAQEMETEKVTVSYRYTALSLNSSSVTLKSGSMLRVQATVLPSNAELIAHQGTLFMSSSNPRVATVAAGSNADTAKLYGDITAVAPGWCTVYVTTGESNGLLAELEVIVLADRTCKLPADLTEIEAEAFAGDTGFEMLLALGQTAIGSRAFAGCTDLEVACLGSQITSIAPDAFEGCDQLTIYCRKDSYAYEYALDNGLAVVVVNP